VLTKQAAPKVVVMGAGSLTDRAEGLRAIVDRGGFAIVQDPKEAPLRAESKNGKS